MLAHQRVATGLGSGQGMDSVVWRLGSLTKDESGKWFAAVCSDDDEALQQNIESEWNRNLFIDCTWSWSVYILDRV
ncbi:hypothetical protein MPTK1_2g05400 [Marchantia polymorpha subsp. ruderalis]|uniref:Uncharacterized protein n=1 Tax=Marchantia polymorpha TaxID=3197 RepID=A0A2R6X823_MARPO|nr:hypothetical protein MARPO_0031s0194 [Marchantia polymorpha]BBN01192.1 hypothetical protein Mp_2g05400 [Marchantia polymorpha subsp. ruderalis]|eukprot:PTQ42243.1 hypothetical protein MARPO_0031s0194 [Marchantia polymorpha]